MAQIHWTSQVDGAFGVAANWTGGVVPASGDDAILDASGANLYTVTVPAGASQGVNSIQLAANAILSIAGGSFAAAAGTGAGVNAGWILVSETGTLVFGNGLGGPTALVDNTGLIALDGDDNPDNIVTSTNVNNTNLTLFGNVSLSGGGTVAINDAFVFGDGTTLTNVDNTVEGGGLIGSGDQSSLSLINEVGGSVIANEPSYPLVIDLGKDPITNAGLISAQARLIIEGDGVDTTVTNTGTILVTGSLVLDNAIVDSVSGSIDVAQSSSIQLKGSTITTGELSLGFNGTVDVPNYSGESRLETSTLDNPGFIGVGAFAALAIEGTINNFGEIVLGGIVGGPSDLVISGNVTLDSGGKVILTDGADNKVIGLSAGDTLTNVDNKIAGAGSLGGGQLTLVNEATGTISASGANLLDVDTAANTITNAGQIKTAGAGGLALGSSTVANTVDNNGKLKTNLGSVLTVYGTVTGTGHAVIGVDGGTLQFKSGFAEDVTFNGPTGTLALAQSQGYTGTITGFSTSGGTSLDLGDIGFVSVNEASFEGTASGGTLTVTDGVHTAKIALFGDYLGSTFNASSDGAGGTIVTDPAAEPSTHRFASAMAGLGSPAPVSSHAADEPRLAALPGMLMARGRAAA